MLIWLLSPSPLGFLRGISNLICLKHSLQIPTLHKPLLPPSSLSNGMAISSFQIFSETLEIILESFLYTLYPIIQKVYFCLQNTSKTQTRFTNSTIIILALRGITLAWLITIVSVAVLASILNLTTIYSYFSQREILYTRFCHSSKVKATTYIMAYH